MSDLEGCEAIVALRARLDGGSDYSSFAEPPFRRLSLALDDPAATELDRSILLRHALRYGSLNYIDGLSLNYDSVSKDTRAMVGLRQSGASIHSLTADPWHPEWLDVSMNRYTDESAMKASRCRFFNDEDLPGDPFLSVMNFKTYKSPGQRDAIRTALSMPAGSTIAIDLPTGEGKSSIFVAIDKVGFASESPRQYRGTTLVIVPTVTLALDHERNYGDGKVHPHAYVGGDVMRNDQIRQQIDEDDQGLCFASPEAVVGPLRHPLRNAASRGTLRAIVVDEAHLVDAWGTGFRTEFQTAAGNFRSWKSRCPEVSCFRTILLSATLSKSAELTLIELFTPDEKLRVVGASRVRPEIEYWTAKPSDLSTRERRVMEALMHLPRPVILYVTRVDDAKDWFRKLMDVGFGRIRVLHGCTQSNEREQVLQAWSEGRLDLVVATSAFGLGIDYPHVRTVIHACVPESFDRFYQEAGRAGRDGCGAISLLIPAFEDEHVAKALSKRVVISVERGYERWTAMFHNAKQCGHPKYSLRLNVAPTNQPNDIDMIGERSIDWNARTLSLMARAGLILLSGSSEKFQDAQERQNNPSMDIVVKDESHLQYTTWQEKVEPKRKEIMQAANNSLNLMNKFAEGRSCPSRMIANLYSTATRVVAVECGGCRLCRAVSSKRITGQLIPKFHSPWRLEGLITEALIHLWGNQQLLVVFYPKYNPSRRNVREFKQVVRKLDKWGLRIFVQIQDPPKWLLDSITQSVISRPWVTLTDTNYVPEKWILGHRLVAFGELAHIRLEHLRSNASKQGTIMMIPEGTPDASRPDRTLAEVLSCKAVSLQEFLSLVLR